MLDLYSRRVIGWAMSDRMTSDLTISALNMALRQRQPAPGLIHHSDRGSQYTDGTYQVLLETYGVQVSINSVGTWYDNAPMESFIGTLKVKEVYHCVYHTRDEARVSLFDYIESFYNRRRRYSALIVFAVFQALPAQRDNLRLCRIGRLFTASCLANIAWLFLWHYEQFPLTLLAMLSLLVLLIVIYLRLRIGRVAASSAEKWLVHIPFSIYLGWITVATIANATSLLGYSNWSGRGISNEVDVSPNGELGEGLALHAERRPYTQ